MTERDSNFNSVLIDKTVLEQKHNWVSAANDLEFHRGRRPLRPDLLDPKRKVGIEFGAGSESDVLRLLLGGECYPDESRKSAAKMISDEVRKNGKDIYFGAFYDPTDELPPALRWPRDSASREQSEAEFKRLLRLQVKGFIDWLKGQGVI